MFKNNVSKFLAHSSFAFIFFVWVKYTKLCKINVKSLHEIKIKKQ